MLVELRMPNGNQANDFRLLVTTMATQNLCDNLFCSAPDPPLKHHHILARPYRAIENLKKIE